MEKIITQSGIKSDKKSLSMYAAVEETIFNEIKKSRSLVHKFKIFCERQQENRIGWAALIMAGQVYLLVPITLLVVFFNGNRFVLWMPVIVSSFVVELSNLTTLPTKITIPIFCASILISLGVIVLSFVL